MQIDLIYIKRPGALEAVPSGMVVLRPEGVPFKKIEEIAQQASERARTLLPPPHPDTVFESVLASLRKAGCEILCHGHIQVET